MKLVRTVGLCLMAVFALSAMAASSASAADLLAKAVTGNIVGGSFLSSGSLARLITHSGKEIHCKDVTNHGKFLSSTLGDVLIRFLGCTAKEGLTVNCNTTGAGTGEIHLSLTTTLFHFGLAHLHLAGGITHRNIPAIVILLHGNVKIVCGGILNIEVRGNVIGALQKANGEPVALNESRSEVNLNFQQTANGLQHLTLILLPGNTTATAFDLESSFAGGAFELASEVVNSTLNGFKNSAGEATNIELVEP